MKQRWQEKEFPGLLYTVKYFEVLEFHAILSWFRLILRSGCTKNPWSSFLFLPWRKKSLILLLRSVAAVKCFIMAEMVKAVSPSVPVSHESTSF